MAAELQEGDVARRAQELRSSIIVVFVAIGLLGVYVSLADFSVYNVVDLLTMLVKK